MTSNTYDIFSSDILICFGLINLYTVVDSSSVVSLWSPLIDAAGSERLFVIDYREELFRKLLQDIGLTLTGLDESTTLYKCTRPKQIN